MREFNITGPCKPSLHYILPPLERAPTVLRRIRAESYLAVSGPRQSGKTSLLRSVVDAINADGWARAVLVSCESAGQRANVVEIGDAERVMLEAWHGALTETSPEVTWPAVASFLELGAGGRVRAALAAWARASDRPLVVVVDEVDTLARGPFVSMLSQIRSGFPRRPEFFPHSIVLAGMRNLRDYDIALGGAGNGSPFNIVESVSVGSFSRDELVRLYAQHTAETGQGFTEAAIELAWNQTRGQPWLVNAIARICVMELVTDTSQAVDAEHIEEAIRRIEAGSTTHLTSLAQRLSEPRVMNVVAPAISGRDLSGVSADDIRYVRELGVLEECGDGELVAANPIYARSLMRALAEPVRSTVAALVPAWRRADGSIDLDKLRGAFLEFWSQHGRTLDPLVTRHEVVPHIVLMAWLDRVANGGGRVDRELAVSRGRLDLLLRHRNLRLPIEVKVHLDGRVDPVPQGLVQLDRYCEGLRVDCGWLVVFDQRTGASGTRLESEDVITAGGRRVLVIRA